MVQVLRDLGIEWVAANPGSSFEGIQESIINYGTPPNVKPEFITALHEESSVTMAHGYGKATGKPMCALLHGTIGIQHAAMSIYQAYYDRAPALLIAGRDLGFIAAHSANDMAGMVRSFVKWDATPQTLPDALIAIQRAYNEAITPPCGPTMVVIDIDLQKQEAGTLAVPAYQPPQISGLDPGQAREIATSAAPGPEPANCRGPAADARRRAPCRRARRARGRVHVDRGHAGAHELPAASSAVRPRRQHVLRLHAGPRATGRVRVAHRPVVGHAPQS